MKKRVFNSCVSSEFHKAWAGDPFVSCRAELAIDLRRYGYEVVTQEDLPTGGSDLLELIEQVIEHSQAGIHVVGDMTGDFPKEPAVRRLLERHPKFLPRHPELRAVLGELPNLFYTRWEAFQGLHFHLPCLIYRTRPQAPRSPEHAQLQRFFQVRRSTGNECTGGARRTGGMVNQDQFCREVAISVHHALEPEEVMGIL